MRIVQARLVIGVVAGVSVIVLAYVFFLRPWHMRWGATDAELALSLPGDAYIPPLAVRSTRALTVDAPAETVWPWIMQLGQGRGGFYSYEWLENLFAAEMYNAESIQPELQTLQVGDHISFQQDGPFTKVALIEPEHALVAEGGWTWVVEPIDENTTRLIVRYASFEVPNTLTKLFYYPIFEPAHFVMESGMMLGIKARAEMESASN